MKVLDKVPAKILDPKLNDADFDDDKVQRLENWSCWKPPHYYSGNVYNSQKFTDGTRIIMSGIVERTLFTITSRSGEVTILGQRANGGSRL